MNDPARTRDGELRPGGRSIAAIADSLAGTFPGREDAPLALALVRELARGAPVSTGALAAVAGRPESETRKTLARWPTVQRDEHGHVIAFSGLSLRPTSHVFEVGGRQLYTWCAWDTLFLPAMLGAPARVGSRCPVTAAPVRLTVEPDGVHDAEPAELRVSFPRTGTASTRDIVGSFCSHVHFLAGPHAGERWSAEHRGAIVLTLEAAFEVGRRATDCCQALT